ncbi:response regulator transcription factor [Isoptericola sp. b441]|uniref:Response regulator transcription factor n=2 Tax=Actinotalea lenta TaxID=3064654 RepID=A0ABT9DDT2_9CELL|nr:response regulator transcription factor [Isoptericola sp. b441]MDO8107172.1 response regulator transcription factor [Isoptericola sp. b441]
MVEVLVVEDDEGVGGPLTRALTAGGYRTTWERTGSAALTEAKARPFDLVLLDLGLPDTDGVDVCRSLRVLLPAAVLVILTARGAELDVVVGLEAGADDYLVKPVGLTELLARIRAHVRRAPAAPTAPAVEPVQVGALRVDSAARRVLVGDTEVALRPKEFDLLERLAVDAGAVVSRERLMSDVWDEHWFGSTKTLDVHVAAVRRKLTEAAGEAAPTITTVRGRGYRLEL